MMIMLRDDQMIEIFRSADAPPSWVEAIDIENEECNVVFRVISDHVFARASSPFSGFHRLRGSPKSLLFSVPSAPLW
jgi:hypothetical protein